MDVCAQSAPPGIIRRPPAKNAHAAHAKPQVWLLAPTVLQMKCEDIVDLGHAALHQLLASVAEHTLDPALISYLTTMPPFAEWSAAEREVVSETCA